MKKRWVGLAVVSAVIIGMFSFAPKDDYFPIARNLEIFAGLYKEVNTYYVDEINPNEVIKKGIDAMLKNLDPYTVYIPEDLIEDYRTMATGEYGGIGATTGVIEGEHLVYMIYEGYPAYEAGLRIGDKILEVDDIPVTGLSHDELGKLLKGQYDTKVNVKVERYGVDDPIDLSLTRKNIKIESVTYQGMLTDDIGMIKLSEFTNNCGKLVEDAAKALKKEGATKLILDLRDNPGGLLHESVNICNLFVKKGSVVVDTKGKIEDLNKTYETLNNAWDTEIPLAVLMSSSSASASEIVAGVMQDYDRGVVIGQKSFGKGLVQATRPLSYNSQLKVTTAKYYTPSGRCIQALDYSHRNADGSVGKVPDSLKTTYYTTNGREVFDGGGVDPDIVIDVKSRPSIVGVLSREGLLFSYANKYAAERTEIVEAKNFQLTESEYEDFKAWVGEHSLEYANKTENAMERLIASAKKENYYSDIKTALYDLKSSVIDQKANDLNLFESEIKAQLEEEIISRYYFEKGIIESTFADDENVLKAIQVLNDTHQYNQILGK
ncbi:MAG: S41 family peptidase [Bacteroidota bacterium]